MMRRGLVPRAFSLALVVVLALGLVGCGGEETVDTKVDPETAAPGAYSQGSEVFIVYPDDVGPVLADSERFVSQWEADLADLGLSEFTEEEAGVLTSSRVDEELRVWMDLGVEGSAVEVAQLTIENRATDIEDHLYVDRIIPAFVAGLGLDGVPAELGLADTDSIFDDGRTAEVTVDGVTLYLAMTKWSLVLGASGG